MGPWRSDRSLEQAPAARRHVVAAVALRRGGRGRLVLLVVGPDPADELRNPGGLRVVDQRDDNKQLPPEKSRSFSELDESLSCDTVPWALEV